MLTYMARKRKVRSTRRRRKARPSRRLTLSGFPIKKLVKMRYVATGQNLDAGAGLIAQQVFRANGVFDPDETHILTGHQPMSYDQWALIYNKYTVLSSKITMSYAPHATPASTPGYFGIMLSSDTLGTGSFSSVDNLLESKLVGSNYKIAGGNISRGNGFPKVTKSFNAKRFFGIQNPVDGNASSAIVTTNPTNEAFFVCWSSTIGGSQDPAAFNFTYIIDYIVLFHDPKNLDGS